MVDTYRAEKTLSIHDNSDTSFAIQGLDALAGCRAEQVCPAGYAWRNYLLRGDERARTALVNALAAQRKGDLADEGNACGPERGFLSFPAFRSGAADAVADHRERSVDHDLAGRGDDGDEVASPAGEVLAGGGGRGGGAWGGGRGDDGDEVASPAGEVLAGGAALAGDLGGERSARGAGRVQLDPLGVDVEFHRYPRSAAGQRGRQVGGSGGHARGVDQVAGGVLAQGAAGDVLAAAQGGAPQPPVRRRRSGLAVHHER